MCNAWNHPINCHCGWGGDGHLGRSSGVNGDCVPRSYTDWAHEAYHSASAAYTNPNARCPVCQKRVYFYQSPEGGRVYFDELGPPWPKHPCTDQVGSKSVNDVTSISRTSASVRYEWQQDGWRPYICDSFALVKSVGCAVIGGILDGVRLALYVHDMRLVTRAPYHLRRRDADSFLLSSVQYQDGALKVIKLIAYRHLKDALAVPGALRPAPLSKPPVTRGVPVVKLTKPRRERKFKKREPHGSQNTNPVRQTSTEKTAMQLAFERASQAVDRT